jgi:hypothetical protein
MSAVYGKKLDHRTNLIIKIEGTKEADQKLQRSMKLLPTIDKS